MDAENQLPRLPGSALKVCVGWGGVGWVGSSPLCGHSQLRLRLRLRLGCGNTTVVQEVYNRDRSPEVDDVEDLAAAATKHLDLLKQKDKAESSFIIEKTVGKLLKTQNTRPFPLYLPTARFFRMGVLLTL